MHSLIKSLVVVAVLSSSLSFAQPEGEVIIRTRDGKSRQGKVLSETQKGYLFATAKGTSVIAFDKIVEIKNVEVEEVAAPAPAAAPTPTPAPVVASAPSTPPPAPQRAPDLDFTAPPPPPTRPTEVSIASEQSDRSAREGFHFGLGAFAGINNGGVTARAQANFEFNFGLPEYRASLNVGYMNMFGASMINVSADNLLQLNFGDVYALAVGVQVGVAAGGIGTYFYGAPVLEPVIIKLGERGQHRLSLSGSVVVLSTLFCPYNYDGCITWAGTVQVTAGYSFYF